MKTEKTLGEQLYEQLPKEIKRCQELLGNYKLLGRPGMVSHAILSADIAYGHKVMADGNLVGMSYAYSELQGWE